MPVLFVSLKTKTTHVNNRWIMEGRMLLQQETLIFNIFSQSVSLTQYMVLSICLSVCGSVCLSVRLSVPVSFRVVV